MLVRGPMSGPRKTGAVTEYVPPVISPVLLPATVELVPDTKSCQNVEFTDQLAAPRSPETCGDAVTLNEMVALAVAPRREGSVGMMLTASSNAPRLCAPPSCVPLPAEVIGCNELACAVAVIEPKVTLI